MTRFLMVWGTSSGAGKSWLTAALCRWAARRGLVVRPYKAQNMSNNARVVTGRHGEAGEIGAAQYFQALAAGVEPTVDMNPVLLKPERDTRSQVIVDGQVRPDLADLPWRERSAQLAVHAYEGLRRVAEGADLVIMEGAGSPAEINLAEADYVNLGALRVAAGLGPAAAVLVTDIDRGGAFAHLLGTQALLPDDLRPLLQAVVLNRFRGDPALLAPGPQMLEARTGLPLLAVIPLLRHHGLPDEDGLYDPPPPVDGARLRIALLCPPHASNLDEFQGLRGLPGVQLVLARHPDDCDGADWLLLPGSKQVSGDLAWLRATRLDAVLARHAAAGGRVLGLCGGLQMLGEALVDPEGHDGQAGFNAPGLGLLPLVTRYAPAKRLRRAPVRFEAALQAPWQALAGVQAAGYEIRCGDSLPHPGLPPPQVALRDAQGQAIGWQAGPVLGLYAHGLLEDPGMLRALFGAAAPTLGQAFDGLADALDACADPQLMGRLCGLVPPFPAARGVS